MPDVVAILEEPCVDCRRIEIIPLEPEQCSYLRREAPSVVSTNFSLLAEEQQQEVLIFFVFILAAAKSWCQTGSDSQWSYQWVAF